MLRIDLGWIGYTYVNLMPKYCLILQHMSIYNRLKDGRHGERKAIKMFLLVCVVIV
jgi:hypothetical protein